jgi:hypothetical protein
MVSDRILESRLAQKGGDDRGASVAVTEPFGIRCHRSAAARLCLRPPLLPGHERRGRWGWVTDLRRLMPGEAKRTTRPSSCQTAAPLFTITAPSGGLLTPVMVADLETRQVTVYPPCTRPPYLARASSLRREWRHQVVARRSPTPRGRRHRPCSRRSHSAPGRHAARCHGNGKLVT